MEGVLHRLFVMQQKENHRLDTNNNIINVYFGKTYLQIQKKQKPVYTIIYVTIKDIELLQNTYILITLG